jgi:hypothetical protein
MFMRRILAALALLAAVPTTAVPASAADDITSRYVHGGGPACDDGSVLARVTEKFSYQDASIVHAGLAIASIDHIRQYDPRRERGLVTRRYCAATAWLSNGRKAQVAYLIEGPALATFSLGWHVESCVVGHDPWRVYDAGCRSLRP